MVKLRIAKSSPKANPRPVLFPALEIEETGGSKQALHGVKQPYVHLFPVGVAVVVAMNSEIRNHPNRYAAGFDTRWWSELRISTLNLAELQHRRRDRKEANHVPLVWEGEEDGVAVPSRRLAQSMLPEESGDLFTPPVVAGIEKREPSRVLRRQKASFELFMRRRPCHMAGRLGVGRR